MLAGFLGRARSDMTKPSEGPMTSEVDSVDWPDALAAAIRCGPVALFVGSGVSRDTPSCLPTGNVLRDRLFDATAAQREIPPHLLEGARGIVGRCRPEALLYIMEEWGGANWKKALEFMLSAPPNANHKIISSLAEAKKVQIVLTTNFDCLVESAMSERVRFRQVASVEDFDSYSEQESSIAILKMHGSLADGKGNPTHETLLGSLVDVANRMTPGFTARKASVLEEILRTHVVIFLGYSGRDEFDILPVIEQASAKQIIWVTHREEEEKLLGASPSNVDGEAALDPPGQLKLSHPSMIRVHAHTCTFLSQLHADLTGSQPASIRSWRVKPREPARSLPSISVIKSPFSFVALVFQMAREWQHGAEASDLALADMEYRHVANPYELLEVYRPRGVCQKELGRLTEARADFERAMAICEETFSKWIELSDSTPLHQTHFLMMSQLCEDLALTDLAAGELDDAEDWINKAVWWSKRLIYPRQITFVARNFATASLIAEERLHESRQRSDLEKALQLAAASTASAVSGSLVELVRSLSNWAWLLLETQQWEKALSKAAEAISQARVVQGPHSSKEKKNMIGAAVAALCGLASTDEEAARALRRATAECTRRFPADTHALCLELFKRALAKDLCFEQAPEAAAACLKGVFALVSEDEEALKSSGSDLHS